MGKPRLIILVRHAQSEGNKNRAVHQTTPDHRVKLTPQGHRQASEAGKKLLGMLRPEDTIQFYTSPYLRTRETTKGMLGELQSHPNYKKIKVYEEPRLREQDFGNFQPCAAEMERVWHERAAYGHFFYRIPNGESAADAYDRVSGFNESLWRQFAEEDFASVLVLVTHGLMTRIFLMKWYHYSVEYFEDLRNVNHCEFIIMERSETTGKYVLQNQLRTWSAYKREQEEKKTANEGAMITETSGLSYSVEEHAVQGSRRWGGCVNGCKHAQFKWYTYVDQHGRDSAENNPNGGNDDTQNLVNSVDVRLRERLEVLGAGRDFGGSKSGAGSDVEDSGSGSGSGSGGDGEAEDDILERVKRRMHRGALEVIVSEGGVGGLGRGGTRVRTTAYANSPPDFLTPPPPPPPPTVVPAIEVRDNVAAKKEGDEDGKVVGKL